MKNTFQLIIILSIFSGCSFFEDHHEAKEGVRKYLSETLHDPDSMEEISWSINRDWVFDLKDTSDINSPLVMDINKTRTKKDSFGEVYHVKLEYRARNGFGAMRKGDIYATYLEDGNYLQFEDVSYSYKLKSFLDVKSEGLSDPRRLYLKNQFFLRNEGKATLQDFREEYPKF